MPLRKTLHRQTRSISRALLVLCSLPTAAVSILTIMHPSPASLVIASVMVPVLVLAWRIHRGARVIHDQACEKAANAAEAERHYFGVLSEVVAVVEGRDRYLAGRSERIAMLAAQMARLMGLSDETASLLGMVGRVHDIGLLSVPPEILRKATGLSGSEYGAVKKHTRVGSHMLSPLTFLHPVLDAVLYHHERMNGTGYPEGLVGEAIPIEARIMAVADSYDAMTHDRPHRNSMPPQRAISELVRCADVGYDRHAVAALAETVHMAHLLPETWGLPAEPEAPQVGRLVTA